MKEKSIKMLFDENNKEFTEEELAVFKRYLEENNVFTDNNFEFFEENLNYYASRYTNEFYFSPAELFHANSNFLSSEEMIRNIELYHKSVEWYNKTVHPEDSEWVVKGEKYVYVSDLESKLKELIYYLNKYPKVDYHCLDILFYFKESIYKYLPQKNFTFRWKENAKDLIQKLLKHNFYQIHQIKSVNIIQESLQDIIIIFPIFIPIRVMLFLGEYGYRSAIINYGAIIERFKNYGKCKEILDVNMFENHSVNNLLGLDGIEKSIFNILICR
ncbi:hypothetical protein Tmath_0474 [Thermoanaerobacter mathranii subsp. mathranii str. A3]|uniref:Uncharacterized protein n=1 Tax=Thermoanaerobacter mathranii subsp. mathranii (strain DSM 11426 / CCUG 53645 / CIP 108742 / A3) TaxID=583358 RepID=A0ABM5LNB6_THEM3|nr:hypothetical protein [Thermoanaerobacter mathranii]ADH60238.1 hypothetical protein Tmath_0474 [Thermoanaerobacter mathranii subsp. mathranii str. A3]